MARNPKHNPGDVAMMQRVLDFLAENREIIKPIGSPHLRWGHTQKFFGIKIAEIIEKRTYIYQPCRLVHSLCLLDGKRQAVLVTFREWNVNPLETRRATPAALLELGFTAFGILTSLQNLCSREKDDLVKRLAHYQKTQEKTEQTLSDLRITA